MSASNWTKCPGCAAKQKQLIEELDQQMTEAYGSVPFDRFEQMRAEREVLDVQHLEPTFREDYEIFGAETGHVHVSYGGSCSKCGIELTFEIDRPIDISGALS